MDGLTALVTGASQGIGREIALELADDGANVVLAARSDGIEETASMIGDEDRTRPVRMDVGDETSVREGIDAGVAAFGGLDWLINNAGIAGPVAPIEDVDREDWDRTLAVNLTGMYLTAKHAIDHLRDSHRAGIINIASISGKRPLINRTPYVASKMAVIGLTRTLAFELGPDDITVNAICPGATRGPRIESVVEAQAERDGRSYEAVKRELFTDDTALDTLIDAEDVAAMVTFLAGPDARHITGQDINVDAGTTWY